MTNEEVRKKIRDTVGVQDLLTRIKKRKLRWYGYISRYSGMAMSALQGTVKGTRSRRREKKRSEDNIKAYTDMGFGDSLRGAENTEDRKGLLRHHLWCPVDRQS